jgi:hypothetical protein
LNSQEKRRFTTESRRVAREKDEKEKKMLRHLYAAGTPNKNAATPFLEKRRGF